MIFTRAGFRGLSFITFQLIDISFCRFYQAVCGDVTQLVKLSTLRLFCDENLPRLASFCWFSRTTNATLTIYFWWFSPRVIGLSMNWFKDLYACLSDLMRLSTYNQSLLETRPFGLLGVFFGSARGVDPLAMRFINLINSILNSYFFRHWPSSSIVSLRHRINLFRRCLKTSTNPTTKN